MTNTSISDTAISEAQRANLDRLLGPPDSSTTDELRWTNVRLRDTAVVGGGLINVAVGREGYDATRARAIADGVYATTLEVLEALGCLQYLDRRGGALARREAAHRRARRVIGRHG